MLRLVVILAACATALLASSQAHAASPGKNGLIAFERDGDIWTVRPDGSRLRRVTHGPANDFAPAWSPRGRWLAFTRSRPFEPARIHAVRPDGSQPRVLLQGQEPAWAPGGRWLAFQRGNAVWIARTNGDKARQLTTPSVDCDFDCGHFSPAWSPDGHWIAFAGAGAHDSWVKITSRDGSKVRVLDHGGSPDWSPDGRWLVSSIWYFGGDPFALKWWLDLFSADRVTRVVLARGVVVPAPTSGYDAGFPDSSWAPNGRRLVAGGPALRILRRNGEVVRTVSHGTAVDPEWQPLPGR